MYQGSDPGTGRSAIQVISVQTPITESGLQAVVRLYESGRLVGQVWFDRSWGEELRSFFRTSASSSVNAFQAAATPIDSSGREVADATVHSAVEHWNLTAEAHQIVPRPPV